MACRLGFGAPEQVLMVGCGPLGRATAEDLQQGRRPRQVVGFLSLPSDPRRSVEEPDCLGSSSGLERALARTPVHEVYLAGSPGDQQAVQEAVRTCETLGVPFAVAINGLLLRRATPQGTPDGYVHFAMGRASLLQAAIKRLFDVLASASALLALSPLLVGIAAAVKLTSRGPVFFRQLRVGQHGRPFHMLKFRSMVQNAEALQAALRHRNEQSGPVFKIQNDPRVTRIGRFLRKHSLDELPQFINVLWGEMSVVGPRPPVPGEVAKYEPWQRRRLSVRPGLTCLWQVSGRNGIGFRQWMYLDLRYIDHWSLRKDLALVLKTVPVVLHGQGAS
ncbi:MAG: sugar transferase [Myxococcales bacterium]